jgi:hypothetical protein
MSNINYANIAKNIVKSEHTPLSKTEKLEKEGWTILNKRTRSTRPTSRKEETTYSIDRKEWNKFCLESEKRWNQYRDEDIYLRGDLSPFYNYKKEIKNLVNEEEIILEELHKRSNNILSDNESDYNSDDELNKNLIF